MSHAGRTLSIRLELKELSFLHALAQEQRQNLSETIRKLLHQGRGLVAVNRYREGSASVERAAELAGMPLGAFLDLLSQLGVESSDSLVDYLEGLEHVRKAW
jgi:predicted HTH domain antitoxin